MASHAEWSFQDHGRVVAPAFPRTLFERRRTCSLLAPSSARTEPAGGTDLFLLLAETFR